jgi:predicted MFS family arabinose efflux permease
MDTNRSPRPDQSRGAGTAPLLPWQPTIAGLCASLVGLGLARFAYTPLLPAIIRAGWFSAGDAAYLAAANLAGYLIGAVLASPLTSHLGARPLLRGAMVLASVAILACAWPVSFGWFFVWRLLSGAAGGTLMVLAASTVLAHMPQARRGLASGVIFTGIGLGIAASGTLVPLMLRQGLSETWIGLGAMALVLTAVAWRNWPAHWPHVAPSAAANPPVSTTRRLRALYLQYALNAVGLVPHMIFLVDFVVRGLGQGQLAGSQYWVVFGLGALVGPVLTGHLADRVGFTRALRFAYSVQAVAVVLPALSAYPYGLVASSFIVGAFTPGVVPLVLGRVEELLRHHAAAQRAAWGKATTAFAALQATAAFAFSFLLVQSHGNFPLLFALGAVAMALALFVELLAGPPRSHRADAH